MTKPPVSTNDRVSTDETANQNTPRAKSLIRRVFGVLIVFFLAVALIGSGSVLLLSQKPLPAPTFVQTWITDSVEAALGETSVTFSEVRIGLTESFAPRLIARDMVIESAQGVPLLLVSQMDITLGRDAALQGDLRIADLDVSGLSVVVIRDEYGAFELQPGSATGEREGEFIPLLGIVSQIDAAFRQPVLSGLERTTIRNIRVTYNDLQSNQTWAADGGQIRIIQSQEALSLSAEMALLTGRDDLATLVVHFDVDRIQETTTFGANLAGIEARDLATQSQALAWLQVLDAPISGAFRADLSEDGLGPMSATMAIGPGTLMPTQSTRPFQFQEARTYFTYVPDERRLVFDVIEVESAVGRFSARASASLDGEALTNGETVILTQMAFDTLELSPDLSGADIATLSGASADFKIELDPFRLQVEHIHIPTPGADFEVTGHVAGLETGWELALEVVADEISTLDLIDHWPPQLVPDGRAWALQNVRGGKIQDLTVSFRDSPEQDRSTKVTLRMSDMRVQTHPKLPLLEDGAGTVALEDRSLTLHLDAGSFTSLAGETISVADTSFMITDLGATPMRADMDFTAHGGLAAMASIAMGWRDGLLEGASQHIETSEGETFLKGRLSFGFPSVGNAQDFRIDVSGEIRDFASDMLGENRRVSSDLIRVEMSNTAFTMSGPFAIGGIPGQGQLRLPMEPGAEPNVEISGEIEVSEQTLKMLGPGSDTFLAGASQAEFSIVLSPNTPAVFSLYSDLIGIGLEISSLGWKKPREEFAPLTVSGTWDQMLQFDRIELRANGLDAEGRLLSEQGTFRGFELDRLRVGDWLDAKIRVLMREGKPQPEITVLGGRFDLLHAPQAGESSPNVSQSIEIAFDEVVLSSTISLRQVQGRLTMEDASLSGAFTGQVNGQAWIQGLLLPDTNGSRLEVRALDAGAVLRAAGILGNIRGGEMVLDLVPTGERGGLAGQMQILGARMTDAPAIASLLSIISVVGLLEQLDGQGLFFSEIDADFQLTPEEIRLFSGSAVSPSIGLSVDGTYQLASREVDIEGVLSPFFVVNSIGSFLTRKGEGLVGFTFAIKGPAQDPVVTANPFSILAPGGLRELLKAPDIPQEDDKVE